MKTERLAMMTMVNLVPPSQRARLREREVARAWIAAGVAGVAALGVWFGVLQAGRVSDEQSHQRMTNAQSRLALVRADAASVAKQRLQLDNSLQAARAVGHHPKWTTLLALLDERRGESVVFTGLSVQERVSTPSEAATTQGRAARQQAERNASVPQRYAITVHGAAPSMRSVNEFAVSLEQVPLFSGVRTLSTGQDSRFGATPAVSFTIECEIAPTPAPPSAKPAEEPKQ
jgi:hypothetical protein